MKNESVKILFELLSKCFEKAEIKEMHSTVNGARAVIVYREDGRDYQITVKPISEPSIKIDPDEFFKDSWKGQFAKAASSAKGK